MDGYSISSRAYLDRAQRQLAAGTRASLFYAAFEVRCGVEARLQEYLEPHAHIPEAKRTDWRVGKLHRTTNEAFQLGDQVARLDVQLVGRPGSAFSFYYTPVSSRLKAIAERLGGYLHAAQSVPDQSFWDRLQGELREAVGLLTQATTGTLLGPMLLNGDSGEAVMPMEILPEVAAALPSLEELRGMDMRLKVRYFADLESARSAT